MDVPENFLEDNIAGEIPGTSMSLPNGKLYIWWRANSRNCNIELAMCKAAIIQPNSNILQGLSLRLVNGHCKTNPDWKLPPGPFKGEFLIFGFETDPRNQYFPVVEFPTSYNTLKQMIVVNPIENQLCTIAESHLGVKIPY